MEWNTGKEEIKLNKQENKMTRKDKDLFRKIDKIIGLNKPIFVRCPNCNQSYDILKGDVACPICSKKRRRK